MGYGMSDYICAYCGAIVTPGEAKPCGHEDAPIIAVMSAVATGEGSAQ